MEKIPTIRTEEDMKDEAVFELESPMRSILERILPRIEKGEYDLIIGIDASGRIPALITEKFINYVYGIKGLDIPKTRFVAGNIDKENSLKEISSWNPQKRVLIVEDVIESGESIESLCNALGQKNIAYDIVTMGGISMRDDVELFKKSSDTLKQKLGTDNIYVGQTGPMDISGRSDLSGVTKKGIGESFSQSNKKVGEEYGNTSPDVQEKINQARVDSDFVVSNLIDWYNQNKEVQDS